MNLGQCPLSVPSHYFYSLLATPYSLISSFVRPLTP
ncbi:hypothetical protein SBA5_150066 [Candidatus Sulfotelmatomonas gaucii]|uniref:Uncharacterized protein n=1 Tax=Candidatus Sulfuritelmatomonas gaucii TaxID=2043161 RepID=A0A2N9L4W2_9BACT|nr:hypothetical protein SBA5_150066 [Candidatus Sulfotelmatomonas gaucii]